MWLLTCSANAQIANSTIITNSNRPSIVVHPPANLCDVNVPLYASAIASNNRPQPDNPVQFTGTASGGTPPYSSWHWDFGDGSSSTLQNPTHSYSQDHEYKFVLTVTDACGVVANSNSYVYVWTPPKITASASASNNRPQIGNTVQFTGTISCAPSDTCGKLSTPRWHWDFGDGSSSTLQNPSHGYSHNGTYNVVLTVTDASDAVANSNLNITTVPQTSIPKITVQTDKSEYGVGSTVLITGQVSQVKLGQTVSVTISDPNGTIAYSSSNIVPDDSGYFSLTFPSTNHGRYGIMASYADISKSANFDVIDNPQPSWLVYALVAGTVVGGGVCIYKIIPKHQSPPAGSYTIKVDVRLEWQ
jgi:PKD repeat protein